MTMPCTAGLWEFPSQAVAAGASQEQRRAAVDALLERILGATLQASRVGERRHLGAIVHIFSHIRMTLQAERLVLEARAVLLEPALIGSISYAAQLLACM